MNSWWHRSLWRIVLFPVLGALGVGLVGLFVGYLHTRADFDDKGHALSPATDKQTARTPIGEAAALVLIADDLERAGKADAEHLRYLSLVHRHDDPTADAAQLDRDRQGLIDLVAALAPPNRSATVVALDPARTLFRLDLRSLDWTPDSWQAVTRGYPYGLNPAADPLLIAAAARLRATTDERLPVVRAEWWVAALVRPPHSDPGGLGLTTKSPPPAVRAAADAHRDRVVDLATAARELRATEDEVKTLIAGAADLQTEFGLAALLRPGGSIPRDAWESDRNTVSAFQELAARLGRGTPIVRR